MPRPQFTLRALLVTMLVVAAFFGGMAMQRELDKPRSRMAIGAGSRRQMTWSETMVLRDGTVWHRDLAGPPQD
jgi:hypothetical protein